MWLSKKTIHGGSGTGLAPNRRRICAPVKAGTNTIVVRVIEYIRGRRKKKYSSGLAVTYRGEGLTFRLPEGI
jgi:hypothetical protein